MRTYYAERPQSALFLIISFALWAAVSLRWILVLIQQEVPQLPIISVILLLFGLLMALEPRLTRSSPIRVHIYLVVQTGLVLVASLFHFELDFFAILYLPLCGQAMLLLPRRAALAWVGILIAATFVGQAIQFGWPESLSFTLLYVAGLIFVAAYSNLTLQARAARERTEQLLSELQEANAQLQDYAGQVEELAAVQERNRLARELHDSVAQTLYGLTLQSEAASRKLSKGQLEQVHQNLSQIQTDAQQTLLEIRLLIFDLLPPVLDQEGLAAALRARLEAVEARSGIKVNMEFDKIEKLPLEANRELYQIAREALNNALKHASASEIEISLRSHPDELCMEIADNGVGFDPDEVRAAGGMGLRSMHERAAQIGAQITLTSAPGSGTRLEVSVPL
ncbi:MAG: sensor histidine kinase [Anaerolineales bacterium]|nr:sensor histidine kinase [Anaerolineales bacterium]